MTRVKRGVVAHKRHKKVLKQTKGFYGRAKNCYRIALMRLEKALQYAYRDRRNRKRDFRRLWIVRINAAVREYGLVYSKFMRMVNSSGLDLNRKMLSEIAIKNPEGFRMIVEKVRSGCKES